MERLIIFRHGKAERSAASGEDFDRALTERGRDDAEAMGRLLAVSGAAPTLALVSSSVRAVQTFEAARAAFPNAAVKTSQGLYLSSADYMLRAAKAETAAETVMIVAHNPGVHDLSLRLAQEGGAPAAELARLEEGFPTSAITIFRFVDDAPELLAFHTPRGSL